MDWNQHLLESPGLNDHGAVFALWISQSWAHRSTQLTQGLLPKAPAGVDLGMTDGITLVKPAQRRDAPCGKGLPKQWRGDITPQHLPWSPRCQLGWTFPLLDALQVDLDLKVLLFCMNPSWKVGGWGVKQWEGYPWGTPNQSWQILGRGNGLGTWAVIPSSSAPRLDKAAEIDKRAILI